MTEPLEGRPLRVALTFDAEHPDRPHAPGVPEGILGVLGDRHVPATWFLQGRWVEAFPELARQVVADGHLVGNHSFYHARLPLLTDDGLRTDIRESERVIGETTGIDPRPWFRCPFGDGARDPRVLAGLGAAGYRHVGWHVDPEDWRDEGSAEKLERRVREGIEREGDGSVVLLHGWPSATPLAVERLLASASEDGVSYVRIDQLGVAPVDTVPW